MLMVVRMLAGGGLRSEILGDKDRGPPGGTRSLRVHERGRSEHRSKQGMDDCCVRVFLGAAGCRRASIRANNAVQHTPKAAY